MNLLIQWKALLYQWNCCYKVYSKITDSELQCAASNIWLVVIPAEDAADAEAPLTECALNVVVSIPADCNVDEIHLTMEDEDTGIYGQT